RVDEIAILADGRGPALQELLTLAKRRGVKVSFRTRDQLSAMAGTPHHQGVVARVAAASYADLDDLTAVAAERAEPAFLLALDQVQALEALKKSGVWIIGTSLRGGLTPWAVDLAGPVCLVLGAEDAGLRPL